MNVKFLILIASFIFAGLLSCETDDLSISMEDRTALEVGSVRVNDQAKSLVGDYIGSGESIGVFVYDAGSSSYVGNNLKFQADGIGSGQKWGSDSQLLLGPSNVSVYGYYPYNANIADITSIPLSMDEQIDYLYAQEATGVNQTNKRVSLTMYHALAVIRLRIKRSADSNCDKLNRVIIEGTNFSNQGILNGKTGDLRGTSSQGRFTLYPELSLTNDYQELNYVVIPSGVSGTLKAYFSLDNKPYETSLGTMSLKQGEIYSYDITVTDVSFKVDGFTVSPWISVIGQNGNLVADKFHNVVSYVDANGNEVFTPSTDCIGVILTANGERLMIEKYEYNSVSYVQALNDFGASPYPYGYCYWGYYGLTMNSLLGISDYLSLSSLNSLYEYGFLPDKYEHYNSSSKNLGFPSTWPKAGSPYALADWAGKKQTQYLKQVAQSDSYTKFPQMSYLLNKFLESSDALGYNDWYIPSCAQLALLYVYKSDLNDALRAIEGTELVMVYYWSCSEKSAKECWVVSLNNGYVLDFEKNQVFNLRLVRDY